MVELDFAALLRARNVVADAIENALNGNMRPNLAAEALMERGWIDLAAVLELEDDAPEDWKPDRMWRSPSGLDVPVHLEREVKTGTMHRAWVTHLDGGDLMEAIVDGAQLRELAS